MSAVADYKLELTKLINALEAAGETKRVEYWRNRLNLASAVYGKLHGAVSITVRVVDEGSE